MPTGNYATASHSRFSVYFFGDICSVFGGAPLDNWGGGWKWWTIRFRRALRINKKLLSECGKYEVTKITARSELLSYVTNVLNDKLKLRVVERCAWYRVP